MAFLSVIFTARFIFAATQGIPYQIGYNKLRFQESIPCPLDFDFDINGVF